MDELSKLYEMVCEETKTGSRIPIRITYVWLEWSILFKDIRLCYVFPVYEGDSDIDHIINSFIKNLKDTLGMTRNDIKIINPSEIQDENIKGDYNSMDSLRFSIHYNNDPSLSPIVYYSPSTNNYLRQSANTVRQLYQQIDRSNRILRVEHIKSEEL